MKIDGHKLKLRHWLAMALILAVAAVACLSCFSCRYDGNTEMGPYVQAPVAVVCDPNEYASMAARLRNINTSLRYVGIEDFEGREDEAVEWFRDIWGAITDNWE